MKRACVIVLAAVCAFFVVAQRTTRRPLRVKPAVEVADTLSYATVDTVKCPGRLVIVSGYEKPLRSMRETVHVTNADTLRLMRAVKLDILYLDVDGNQVHRKSVSLDCNIPPGETKMLSFKSWDIQNRFFYSGGPKPRVPAYPFTVRMLVEYVVYSRH